MSDNDAQDQKSEGAKKIMWMVYDNESGLIGIYSNRKEAVEVYEDHKSMIEAKDEVEEDDQVILASIEQHSFATEAVDDPSYWELEEKVY